MNFSIPYWKRLLNPLWQKKRLEVLSSVNFSCQSCPNTEENELHVHHEFYEKGAEPWEAPAGTLVSLCKDCHAEREQIEHDLKLEIGRICALLTNRQLSKFAAEVVRARPRIESEIKQLEWDEDFGSIEIITGEEREGEKEHNPYQWIASNVDLETALAFARRTTYL